MPKVTIWIREEDYPKWKAIGDKPSWLHIMLERTLVNWKQNPVTFTHKLDQIEVVHSPKSKNK